MRGTAIVICLLSTGVATAQEPKTIAAVRTWGDLQDQPLITLKNGTKVRVGLEAGECPRNSHFLMYALVEGHRWERPEIGGPEFGPLSYSFTADGNDKLEFAVLPQLVKHEWHDKSASQILFAKSIRMGQAGKCVVKLYECGQPLATDNFFAKGSIAAVDKLPNPWIGFDTPYRPDQPKPDPKRILSLKDAVLAAPICDGTYPVMANFAGAKAIPRTQELPRWSFTVPDPRVKLAADAKTLQITPKMKIDRQSKWLYRLWINDQPFRAKVPSEELRDIVPSEEHSSDAPFSIQWDFDSTLVGAKKGDRIAVQMLLLLDDWEPITDTGLRGISGSLEREMTPRWPILTNKAEFVAP